VQSRGKLTANTFDEFDMRGVDSATIIGEQIGPDSRRNSRWRHKKRKHLARKRLWMPSRKTWRREVRGRSDNVCDTFHGAMNNVMAAWRD